MKKLVLSITVALALGTPMEVHPNFRQKIAYLWENKGNILKDCLLAGTISLSCVLGHEAGHALAAKALYGEYNEIGLGGCPTDHTYLTIPWFNIKFKGINRAGYCSAQYTNTFYPTATNKNNYLKNMAIAAAGPVFGLLSSIICLKLLRKHPSSNYRYPISQLMCCLIAKENIWDNAIPDGQFNDGQYFYKSYQEYRGFNKLFTIPNWGYSGMIEPC